MDSAETAFSSNFQDRFFREDITGQDRTGQDRTGQDRTGQDRMNPLSPRATIYML